MTKFIILTFTIISFQSFAQETQQEINDQVWKPFIDTFNNFNTNGFMALHSKDLVRSPRDGKEVLSWNMYFEQMEKGNRRELSSHMKQLLELRFTERLSNPNQAIDVGVYKTTSIRPDGTSQSGYGRFHVVLRKENGLWKILVDTDSSEGNTIGEKEFLAASPLE